MFFGRYTECIGKVSGSKTSDKDLVGTPHDFSYVNNHIVKYRGPFSFWPQFITHFDMKSEQEAKLRQLCLSEYQKLSGVTKGTCHDTPSRHINQSNL